MGDDNRIEQAARVSYGEGTRKVTETRGLIRYLMRHRHTTPFEMCEVCFKVRVPMDCWRQWIRHRTANVNEYSTRYSEAIDSQQKTTKWRLQNKSNKQGSEEFLDSVIDSEELTNAEKDLHDQSRLVYERRLDYGVAREQARKDLPLSTYTEAYWKIDLHNLFHFLSLRLDSHAQLEIRSYANVIGYEFVQHLFPIAWEAFVDYRLEALFLTRVEVQNIRAMLKAESFEGIKNKREREECITKLKKLGVVDGT